MSPDRIRYDGLRMAPKESSVPFAPTEFVRTDARFNMLRVLHAKPADPAFTKAVHDAGGLAHYRVSIEELEQEGMGTGWFPVRVGDGKRTDQVRPRSAQTGFTTAEDLAEAVRDADVVKALDRYMRKLDFDDLQFFPERGYNPIEMNFDAENPDCIAVTDFFDTLNMSARTPQRKRALMGILASVRERLRNFYAHTWEEGDMILWEDRRYLHCRLPIEKVARDECAFDNNNTWHIDQRKYPVLYTLLRLPQQDQLAKIEQVIPQD